MKLRLLAALTMTLLAAAPTLAQTTGRQGAGSTGTGSTGGTGSSNSGSSFATSGTAGLTDALRGDTLLGGFNNGGRANVASSNPFAQFYANPLTAGLPSGPQVSFGYPVYATTSSTATGARTGTGTGTTGGNFGTGSTGAGSRTTSGTSLGNNTFGTGSSLNRSTTSTGGGFGANTPGAGGNTSFGNTGATANTQGGANAANRGTTGGFSGQTTTPFTPAGPSGLKTGILYTTTPAFRTTAPTTVQINTDLQGVLARSTSFSSPASIQVVVGNNAVVLRGTAASADDRILAENLVRLSPGVRDVVNEIEVRQPAEQLPTP